MFTKDSRMLNHRLTTPLTAVANAVGDVFKPTYNQLIKYLFANNEQGFYFDPNDLSTMFQDVAGTVPVTGAGQPVGLMLDKSKQLSFTPRINLIAYSNVFSDTAWTKLGGVTVTDNQVVAPDGTTSAALVIGNTYESNGVFQGIVNKIPLGTIVTRSIYLRSVTGVQTVKLVDPIFTDRIVVCNLTETWQRFSLTEAVVRDDWCGIWIRNIQAAGIYVWGAQVEVGSIASAYQQTNQLPVDWLGNHAYQTTSASRPILRQNATTGAYYLEFDGSDDFLVTNSIDFTATDKMSLFAGVRKLSDAQLTVVFEFSKDWTSNAGSFVMHAPYNNGGSNFYSGARGTATASALLASTITGTEYASPVSAVVSSKHDISGDYSKMIVNGVNGSIVTANKGTGNFGNYQLYIGRRGGTYLPLNGHIYGLIGIGRLTTNNETKALEKLIAKNTGVTLSV